MWGVLVRNQTVYLNLSFQFLFLQVGLREACKNYIEKLKSSTVELHSTLENIQLTELSQDLLEMSLTEMDKEVILHTEKINEL